MIHDEELKSSLDYSEGQQMWQRSWILITKRISHF